MIIFRFGTVVGLRKDCEDKDGAVSSHEPEGKALDLPVSQKLQKVTDMVSGLRARDQIFQVAQHLIVILLVADLLRVSGHVQLVGEPS